MILQLPRQRQLNLQRPAVMGILNLTPDSFSDGGSFIHLDAALRQTEKMLNAGASIIDVGGESTRPGAADVVLVQELERVIPVITAIRQRFDCVISIDTSKALVMSEAVQAGADIINDVCALQQPGALAVAVASKVPVCLMHMQGAPRTMQHQPSYLNVVQEVKQFLQHRAQQCITAGVLAQNIVIDPGFGFGKNLSHNYQLLQQLAEFVDMGMPVLAGMSRKSMIGELLGVPATERMIGSVACATIAVMAGAQIIRVHDVKETVQAVRIATAVRHGA